LPEAYRPAAQIILRPRRPEKRTRADIARALELIAAFEKYFDVILGLNEKEGCEIGGVLGLDTRDHSPEGLVKLAQQIRARATINTVSFTRLRTPWPPAKATRPRRRSVHVETKNHHRRGRHFNAGFCLGKFARPRQRGQCVDRRDDQRVLCANGEESGDFGLDLMLNNWPTS